MEQPLIKKNIHKYMKLKGYRYYSDLLYEIAKKLNKSSSEAKTFVIKEKSNFSKMLNGIRPLKYEYIIPLEEIFGVSLAKLLNEDLYNININKEDIPYLKSFRYYAYKDDPSLYLELDKLVSIDNKDIINNSDEYNRYFIDYLIEYRSYNGLKYLIDKHNLYFDNDLNDYLLDDHNLNYNKSSKLELARFIISSNDPKLFNKVFSPFNYFMNYHYLDKKYLPTIYVNNEFIEAILNNNKIFKLLFKERKDGYQVLNYKGNNYKDESIEVLFINPLLNIVLDYSLNNLKLYKKKAKEIIEFGISFNNRVLKLLSPNYKYKMSNLGTISDGRFGFYGNLVHASISSVSDEEIDALLNELPKLNSGVK